MTSANALAWWYDCLFHYQLTVNVSILMRLQLVSMACITSELAVISLLAYIAVVQNLPFMFLLLLITIRTQRNLYRRPRRLRPLAIFFLNTLICDLFQAFSAALDARWASLGRVVEDNFCVAQGQSYTTIICSL